MFDRAAPPTASTITWTHSVPPVGRVLHSLTLTSRPRVWRQCCLNTGKTCSLRALRSAALSAHKEKLLKPPTFSHHHEILFTYPQGWSSGRSSRRTSFGLLQRAQQRSEAAVSRGKKSRGPWKRNVQQEYLAAWTEPACRQCCCFSFRLLRSGNSALTCLHSWLTCTRPLRKVLPASKSRQKLLYEGWKGASINSKKHGRKQQSSFSIFFINICTQ